MSTMPPPVYDVEPERPSWLASLFVRLDVVSKLLGAIAALAGLVVGFFGLPAVGVTSPTAAPRPTVTVPVPGPTVTVTATATATATAAAPAGSASPSDSAQPSVSSSGGVSLTDLNTLSDSNGPMTSGQATMNAQSYSDVLSNGACGAQSNVYDLGRAYKHLTGLLGIDDSSHDTAGDVEISADGQRLQLARLTLGHTVPVDVNVSGALRLTITYWSEAGVCTAGNPTIVFANPKLLTY